MLPTIPSNRFWPREICILDERLRVTSQETITMIAITSQVKTMVALSRIAPHCQ